MKEIQAKLQEIVWTAREGIRTAPQQAHLYRRRESVGVEALRILEGQSAGGATPAAARRALLDHLQQAMEEALAPGPLLDEVLWRKRAFLHHRDQIPSDHAQHTRSAGVSPSPPDTDGSGLREREPEQMALPLFSSPAPQTRGASSPAPSPNPAARGTYFVQGDLFHSPGDGMKLWDGVTHAKVLQLLRVSLGLLTPKTLHQRHGIPQEAAEAMVSHVTLLMELLEEMDEIDLTS